MVYEPNITGEHPPATLRAARPPAVRWRGSWRGATPRRQWLAEAGRGAAASNTIILGMYMVIWDIIWDILGIFLGYSWDILGIFLEYYWDIIGIYSNVGYQIGMDICYRYGCMYIGMDIILVICISVWIYGISNWDV